MFRQAVRQSTALFARRVSTGSSSSFSRASGFCKSTTVLAAVGLASAATLALSSSFLANSNQGLFAEETQVAEEEQANEAVETTSSSPQGSAESTSNSEAASKGSASEAAEVALESEYPYVIVGMGTAGYAAAKAILSRDPEAKILMIGDEGYSPYMRPPLSKELWTTGAADVAETLSFVDWQGRRTHVFYDPFHANHSVRMLKGHKVISMDVGEHELQLDDGRKVKYHRCVIATGGTPRTLPVVPESIKQHVSTYRTVDDFRTLDAVTRRGGRIVVVGGSFLGTEVAYAIASTKSERQGTSVVSVYPEPGVLARILPRYLSDFATSILGRAGVELYPNRIVTRVEEAPYSHATEDNSNGSSGKRVRVHLDNNQVIDADHVLVATGILPNTSIFADAGLEIDPKNGGITCNAELEARTDVFVAGDVASFYSPVLGRRRVEHYDHAESSGWTAGLNAAGARKVYNAQPFFWSSLGETAGIEAVGELDSNLDTIAFWDKVGIDAQGAPWYFNSPPAVPKDYGKGVVYYMKNKRVVGVLLFNTHGKIQDARRAIASKKQYSQEELKNLIQV
ncbi:mitochondrial mitochondrial_apoptosis-inducing_factor_(AIF) [Andalucia godoyi]|uniref:Mitochondrial mitochondrial_apoptosis-inducing_factor_(AIF) n=1 Tax=Andalucia godoyi TaxID=505711 RepID=A0A8K0F4J4_ANDGO|nr:mitochondrial mitochondrial_apoptosis-inducing_factor_(AIF) [Andalucia godoyi]|eukprot:ANDGO_06569.mRNA.1 mitochondrial mitochondrial_apoptosis-inducing_factor_(AIF)